MLFAHPRILWLLALAVPLLGVFFWWSWRKRQKLTAQFVQSRLLAHLTVGVSKTALKVRMALLVVATTFLFFTLARPMWGEVSEEVRQRGLDIVVAIDTSRSMLAEDLSPNRLTRAKLAALDLLRLAKSDRLGLVAFAGSAFLQCPLTLDEEAFRQSINALEVGIIPQGGTALAEAIDASLSAFKADSENFKILVLFTDGEDNEAGASDAVQRAKREGMRIFTVGVGTASGEVLRVRDAQGAWDYVKDDQGNVVKSRLNESVLTEIATATEGFYLRMSGANTMDVLYRQGLAPLPRGETTTKLIRSRKEQFMWPLSLAILVLLLEIFLPERKRVQRPAIVPVAPVNEELRKAVAAAVALLLCAVSASASPGSALRNYEKGRFDEAHEEFQKLAEKRPADARLHYNAGAAAYQAEQYEKAAKHFMSALNPENLPLQQSAYYNLGNAHFRLGEQQENPQQRGEAWQEAVHDYEAALKLDPKDGDAQFNLALVRKRLEELQKQQNQSKQQNKDESKDDKDQDKHQDQQQQEKDDEKKKQEGQKSEDQKQDQDKAQQGKSDQEKSEEQPQSAQDRQKPDDKERPEDKNSSQAQNEPGKDQNESAQTSTTPGQMTKEQVQKLLDAQKSEEKAMIFQPPKKARSRERVFKDW